MELVLLWSRRKRGDSITVQELREKLGLTHTEFCDLLGIKKSAYYNKINELNDWTFTELRILLELKQKHRIKGDLTVSQNGINYKVSIKEIA